jgi:2'-5' RNA ligase
MPRRARPYAPFLEDERQIASLEGQRFVVLRAGGQIGDTFERYRNLFRGHVGDADVSSPAQAHVTLAGFAAGAPLEIVQTIVEEWSRTVPPLGLDIERLTLFPPPFQVVALQVRKTPTLFEALASLRALGVNRGLTLSTVVPAEQWIFHVSLLYGASLDEATWRRLGAVGGSLEPPQGRDVAVAAEVVAFDQACEHSGGVYTLRADPWRLEADHVDLVEGLAGGAWLRSAGDVNAIVEACGAARTNRVLLEPGHLPPAFFDLSSGEAGAILQKLRQYDVRLAVVASAESARFSSRFGEAVAEERDRGWFALFDERDAARQWLRTR